MNNAFAKRNRRFNSEINFNVAQAGFVHTRHRTMSLEMLHCDIVRGLERRLSIESLRRALQPFAFARSGLESIFKNLSYRPLPPFFDRARLVSPRRNCMENHLNRVIEFLPDRLNTEKWRARCQIFGLEQLRQMRQKRRPVLLAFSHFGAYTVLRQWLRAAGIPAITLVDGDSEQRPGLKHFADRISPFPEIPSVLYRHQLREVMRFLDSGNPLLIALDGNRGKQLNVPICGDWCFRMATGPMRLAARHDAELVACSIVAEGVWQFRMDIGEPVPSEFLATESGWIDAGKHLLDTLLPQIQSHPAQCASKYFLRHFQQESPVLNSLK